MGAQVNAGPDSTICKGVSIQLQGTGQTGYSYLWTSTPPDPSISNPNILTPTVQPSTTTIYTLEGTIMSTTNLVDNGDFEQGNTGFTSDYDYCDQPNCLYSSPPYGEYGIGNNPNYFHTGFPSCGDHTSGSGNMMICNGDEYLNFTLYETTVNNISTYTEYELSAWITSLVWSIPQFGAHFSFEINGNPVGTYSATSNICTWGNPNFIWNSGSASSAVIRIVNTSAIQSGLGNDFALDDITLREVFTYTDYCVVTVVDVPTSDFEIDQPACFGDTVLISYTGNAAINATYNWDFGIDPIIISGTGQGPYEVTWYSSGNKTVTLWVDNGCTSNTTYNDITISESPDIDVTADEISIPYGTTTTLHGIITSGSSPQFNWIPASLLSNPTSLDPQTIPLEQTTTYFFNVTDGVNLCNSTDSITIEVTGGPLTLVSIIASPDTICDTESSELMLDVTGGSESYTATWTSNPPGFSQSGPEMLVTVFPNGTTTYYVEVDDGYNVVSSYIEVVVSESTIISAHPQSLNQISGTSATFTTTASYADSYQWQISTDDGVSWNNLSNANAYSGVDTPVLVIFPIDITMNGDMFRCNVTGSCDNPVSDIATLTIFESPNFISTLNSTEGCEGETISINCIVQNFIQITDFTLVIDFNGNIVEYSQISDVSSEINDNLTIQNNTNSITFNWSEAEGRSLSDGLIFNILFNSISEGTSPVNWDENLSIVTNLTGTHPTMNLLNGEIIINPLPTPITSLVSDYDTINIIDEIPVTITSYGGSGEELVWSKNSCDGDTIGIGTQIEFMRPDYTTNYFAYWINQCGKSECAEKEIVIIYDYNVGIPNAFTPNNDGLNDEFKIVCVSPLINFRMQIYNRGGLLLFESNDQNEGWNGMYKNSILPVGVYVWRISYETITKANKSENISKSGTVTLIQ